MGIVCKTFPVGFFMGWRYKMREGFIKLHRKLIDWGWYKDPNVLSVFIHILLLANWEDKEWQGQIIKRGSFITSVEHLSSECGLTVRQIRTVLDKLLYTQEIDKRTTNKYTLITVNKYDEYQSVDKQMTNERQTNDKQMTTTKNIKKERNKEVKRVIEKVYTPPNLTDKDFIEIAEKYRTTLDFVKFQYDKMVTWAESNPTNPRLKGRNWRMTLMTFVRDDALKIKQNYAKDNSDLALD